MKYREFFLFFYYTLNHKNLLTMLFSRSSLVELALDIWHRKGRKCITVYPSSAALAALSLQTPNTT